MPEPDITQGETAESDRNHLFVGVSLLLFFMACATPCLEMSPEGERALYGLQCLASGWLAFGIGQFAWLANPLWLTGVIAFVFRKWRVALTSLGLALFFALNTLLLVVNEKEDGTSEFRLRIGFYFWLASMLVLFVGAFVMRMRYLSTTTNVMNQHQRNHAPSSS